MSLSQPTLTNPAQHFFEWAGSKGQLQWWNKDEQKSVQVRLPFEFIVLDQLNTITGYSKLDASGFWSNEVRSTKKDEIYVRTKKGPFEAGLYENLTQTMKKGGKFAKSIYLAHKGPGGEWIIGNFKASGSALSAWIEFTKHANVSRNKVVLEVGEQQEAPTGMFFPPTFKTVAWSDDEFQTCVKLDKELQVYLSQYLSANEQDGLEDRVSSDVDQSVGLATDEQIYDYNARKESGFDKFRQKHDEIKQRVAEKSSPTSVAEMSPEEWDSIGKYQEVAEAEQNEMPDDWLK